MSPPGGAGLHIPALRRSCRSGPGTEAGYEPVQKAGPVTMEHVFLALHETEAKQEARIRTCSPSSTYRDGSRGTAVARQVQVREGAAPGW